MILEAKRGSHLMFNVIRVLYKNVSTFCLHKLLINCCASIKKSSIWFNIDFSVQWTIPRHKWHKLLNMLTYVHRSRFIQSYIVIQLYNYILWWVKYRTFCWYINRKYLMYVFVGIYALSLSYFHYTLYFH